ncbi:MAG: glutamine amidotransferase [Rhodobiaceae bacterium]|nr:glutamine amidotransferase [Rhodobiaceae bacterium]
MKDTAKRRILIVVHQEHSSPGRVGEALVDRGYELDIRRPRFGDPLPDTMADHAGAVIFGGPMSANDTDDFILREIDWIDVPLREEAPFLGICLGAQMLAKMLGARVAGHPDGYAEIGYYPVRAEPIEGFDIAVPGHVYQWHREGFDMPSGGERFAAGDVYPNQGFRYGPAAFGIQFHPELTLEMMDRWTTKGAERFKLPGAQGRDAHFEGRARYDDAILAWLGDFIDHWLVVGRNATESQDEGIVRL